MSRPCEVLCPSCGGPWKITYINRKPDHVQRYHTCKDCGYKGRTDKYEGHIIEVEFHTNYNGPGPKKIKPPKPKKEPKPRSPNYTKSLVPRESEIASELSIKNSKARRRLEELNDFKELFKEDPLFP